MTSVEVTAGPELQLETHRVELTAYCYRMLASAFEAEDAVQEITTLIQDRPPCRAKLIGAGSGGGRPRRPGARSSPRPRCADGGTTTQAQA